MEHVSRSLLSLYRDTPQHGEWIVTCLQGAWRGLVGDRLAAACRPVAWKGGRLTLQVFEAEWFNCLQEMKTELVERLQALAGDEIRDIEIR